MSWCSYSEYFSLIRFTFTQRKHLKSNSDSFNHYYILVFVKYNNTWAICVRHAALKMFIKVWICSSSSHWKLRIYTNTHTQTHTHTHNLCVSVLIWIEVMLSPSVWRGCSFPHFFCSVNGWNLLFSIFVRWFSSRSLLRCRLDIIWWKWWAHSQSEHCVSLLHSFILLLPPGCFFVATTRKKARKPQWGQLSAATRWSCESCSLHQMSALQNVKLAGANAFTHLWRIIHCPLYDAAFMFFTVWILIEDRNL